MIQGRQVRGTRDLAPGTRYRIDAEGRTPSTEDRARLPENAHMGYAGPWPVSLHLTDELSQVHDGFRRFRDDDLDYTRAAPVLQRQPIPSGPDVFDVKLSPLPVGTAKVPPSPVIGTS
jgi:hypothetical protein